MPRTGRRHSRRIAAGSTTWLSPTSSCPTKRGLETITTLCHLNPDVRIIAISGGGIGRADDYLIVAKKLGASRVLAKPFSVSEIVTAVAEVLARPLHKHAR